MNYKPITELIPQRPPFLFVDKIDNFQNDNRKKIIATYLVRGDEDFFKGHFPGNPIMPGVLLQEALFQTGAALMSLLSNEHSTEHSLGVVARVQNAKFKNMVKPNDLLLLEVELVESILNAHIMKGFVKVDSKTVLALEFTVASIIQ
jgi:3-hydroxyacyl-[acyl-carrier-protein] dehydratase